MKLLEMIVLAHNCRELFPIIDMIPAIGEAAGLPKQLTTMHVSIHEDNAEALTLAETLQLQYTP